LHRRVVTRQATISTEPLSAIEDEDDDESEQLLHPEELFDGTIPYPKALSPSSM